MDTGWKGNIKMKQQFLKRKYGTYLSLCIVMLAIGAFLGASFNDKYELRIPWVARDYSTIISPMSTTPTPSPKPKKTSYLPKVEVANAEALVTTTNKQQEPDLKTQVLSYFPTDQRDAVNNLIFHESTWNPYAINYYSGACGLGQ